jgi:hypothetical protein
MHVCVQKSLNSLAVNWVPLLVIMLLGTPSPYMISQMNSTTLATIMEAPDFALIHLVNLSTTMKMRVNPPFAFLIGPSQRRTKESASDTAVDQ